MVKKISLAILIILILCGNVILLAITNSKDMYNVNMNLDNVKNSVKLSQHAFKVSKGDLEHVIEFNGSINADVESYKIVDVKSNINNFKYVSKIGQLVRKDQILASTNNRKVVATEDAYVMNVTQEKYKTSFELLNLSDIYIDAQIPVEYYNNKLFDKVYTIINNGNKYTAKIQIINPIAEKGMLSAKLLLSKPDMSLILGQDVVIQFLVDKKDNVLIVPKKYIIKSDDLYQVLLINDETIIPTNVEIGLVTNGAVEVVSGIKEDDVIDMVADGVSMADYEEKKKDNNNTPNIDA